MAWRIDDHVIRGEIDNRARGRVTGRLWFVGRTEPVMLDLTGNTWRDLAGRRLEFVNPEPKPGLPDTFAAVQRGAAGDITASRKVKVPEVPLEQIGEYYARRQPFPWHWGNCLHLEWFSGRNGRIAIESAHFELTVAADATWDMTESEELEQRRANGEALTGFIGRLAAAAERTDVSDETPADDDRPQTEEEADRMMADSDKHSDRLAARPEQVGPEADFERILEEELERRRAERHQKPLTPEQEAERARWIEEVSRAAEEAADAPEVRGLAEREHPLAERAQALALRLATEPASRGWIGEHGQSEHPVVALMQGGLSAAGKLAGALNGRKWPPTVDECGLCISWLKRARGYVDDALAAADACAEEELTDPAWLAEIRAELAGVATEADRLIVDLRNRLDRGFD